MLFLYALLCGMPTETSDPHTKERYGLLSPLILHVAGQVMTTVLELLMALVVIDVLTDDLLGVSVEAKGCLVEYMVGGLVIMVPAICVLISGLIYGGLLVER